MFNEMTKKIVRQILDNTIFKFVVESVTKKNFQRFYTL